ncbi:MAG TPA: radical SAM family heme chaperone HemW [Bacteroidales bacterium]|jgi:oxygen-independent coproporphyrinogen-3 oxidase|nr:radical SAM family heme chaperone HemW [Bacteroidales bacterium]HPI29242.1 radical SAM family heme chaperone HemW [Bacteroidales bacterium]
MAGIYIHIPFCKRKCHYCNFYSVPSLRYKDELIAALHNELLLQKNYLDETVETIYFGGGTPSLLAVDDVKRIIDTVRDNYLLHSNPEITLEANPDDVDAQKVMELKNSEINRVSIGVQSFFHEDLKYLNRIHTSEQAEYAIKALQDAGLENLSIDFIYGMPSLGQEHWRKNLSRAVDMQVPHISAYAITVEPNTTLETLILSQKKQPISEAEGASEYRYVMKYLPENNYIHYEISNFCLPGFQSKHNSMYWENKPYLGIGPSAHSFNLKTRSWNINNIEAYLAAINNKTVPFESEELTVNQQFNEFVLMGLRTNRGVSVKAVGDLFGPEKSGYFQKILKKYENKDLLAVNGDNYQLSDEGKLFADRIISDFFVVD